MKKIVLFASGSGTNVENIIKHFGARSAVTVAGVFCNNPNARVIDRAIKNHIPVVVFSKEDLRSNVVLEKLTTFKPDLIVLAGFLLQLPSHIISAFAGRIINIHPALLPKYGGKGMYGSYVHETVFDNREKESGITIHLVNEHYDDGEIIFQKAIPIDDCSSAEDVANKVQKLEHEFFPLVIEQYLNQ